MTRRRTKRKKRRKRRTTTTLTSARRAEAVRASEQTERLDEGGRVVRAPSGFHRVDEAGQVVAVFDCRERQFSCVAMNLQSARRSERLVIEHDHAHLQTVGASLAFNYTVWNNLDYPFFR